MLPLSERNRLGFELADDMVDVLRGDGTPTSMLSGSLPITLLGRRRIAQVLLSRDSDAARDETSGEPLALIGLGLMRGCRITADLVPQGAVVIERPIPHN